VKRWRTQQSVISTVNCRFPRTSRILNALCLKEVYLFGRSHSASVNPPPLRFSSRLEFRFISVSLNDALRSVRMMQCELDIMSQTQPIRTVFSNGTIERLIPNEVWLIMHTWINN